MRDPEDILQEGDVLNVGEASKILKISEDALRKIIRDEREPRKIFAKKIGRRWKILREELDKLLLEREIRRPF